MSSDEELSASGEEDDQDESEGGPMDDLDDQDLEDESMAKNSDDDEQEENDDDAPREVRNKAQPVKNIENDDSAIVKSARRKRRNKSANDIAPDDDVLERAKQARLLREQEQLAARNIKEFDDEDDEDIENTLEDALNAANGHADAVNSQGQRVEIVDLNGRSSKPTAMDSGALKFAKRQLKGRPGLRKVPFAKQAAKKWRGPAILFSKTSQ